MIKTGIYKIQSILKPERVYIGSASNFVNRKSLHLLGLRRNNHSNNKLQRHYNKYGESDLVFIFLVGCEKSDLLKQEQFFIDSINPYFNIIKIAGSHLGAKRSESMKEKMRIISKGRKLSEEAREKIRTARKNQKNTVKGKHWILSKESRENIGKGHIGLKLSEQTRLRISMAVKGKKRSAEQIKNMCKPRTEEHKRKMREGWAKRKERLSI